MKLETYRDCAARLIVATIALGLTSALAVGMPQDTGQRAVTTNATAAQQGEQPPAVEDEPADELDPIEELLDEMRMLLEEVQRLRLELAQARLERNQAERELAELRQFIDDHAELGEAYEQYTAVKEVKERQAHRKRMEQRRREYERRKAEREAERKRARAQRQAEQAEQQRRRGYREAGFGHIGLDVYFSRASYFYSSKDESQRFSFDVDDDDIDFFRGVPRQRIDFSTMTISGSVLNAADVTRNIGIAIIFFDQFGKQVGHEIVQINNARPDVPYPFTSEVEMALNRPFSSSSQYVLYADPVQGPSGSDANSGGN